MMSLMWYAQPGGEKYLPFAKIKLRRYHEQMLRAGTRVLERTWKVSDGSVIYISSIYKDGHGFQDRVRITAGGLIGYLESVGNTNWLMSLATNAMVPKFTLTNAISPTGLGDTSADFRAWNKGGSGVINKTVVARSDTDVYTPAHPGSSPGDRVLVQAYSAKRDWAMYEVYTLLSGTSYDAGLTDGATRLNYTVPPAAPAWVETRISYHFPGYDTILSALGVSVKAKHASQNRPVFNSTAVKGSTEFIGTYSGVDNIPVSVDGMVTGGSSGQGSLQARANTIVGAGAGAAGGKWRADVVAVRWLDSVDAPTAAGWVSTNGNNRSPSTDTEVYNLRNRNWKVTILAYQTNTQTGGQALVSTQNYSYVQPIWLTARSPSGSPEIYDPPGARQEWLASGTSPVVNAFRISTEGDVYLFLTETGYSAPVDAGKPGHVSTVALQDDGSQFFFWTGNPTGTQFNLANYSTGTPWLFGATGQQTAKHVLYKNGAQVWSKSITGPAPASAGTLSGHPIFTSAVAPTTGLGTTDGFQGTTPIWGGVGLNRMSFYYRDPVSAHAIQVEGVNDVFTETDTGVAYASYFPAVSFSKNGDLRCIENYPVDTVTVAATGQVLQSFSRGTDVVTIGGNVITLQNTPIFLYDKPDSWYVSGYIAATDTYATVTFAASQDKNGAWSVSQSALIQPKIMTFGAVINIYPPTNSTFIPFSAVTPGSIVG